MGFDLSNVIARAKQVSEGSGSNKNSRAKVLYPQEGRLKVKLLFNPKSGVVLRKYDVHRINDQKVYCLSQYGKDCPVCQSLDTIESTTGAELWKYKRTSRAIAYAIYVGHKGYTFDNPKYEPTAGELIMIMLPWSLYSSINKILADEEVDAERLVASNVGPVLNIDRKRENGRTNYECSIDINNLNYKIKDTDREFMEMMEGLESLNDSYAPVEISDEMINLAVDASNQLEIQYLSSVTDKVSNIGNTGSNIADINQKLQADLNNTKNSTSEVSNAVAPSIPNIPNNAPAFNPQPIRQTDDLGNVYELDSDKNEWVMIKQAQNSIPPLPNANTTAIPPLPNANTTTNSSTNPECFKDPSKCPSPKACMLCPVEAECKGGLA